MCARVRAYWPPRDAVLATWSLSWSRSSVSRGTRRTRLWKRRRMLRRRRALSAGRRARRIGLGIAAMWLGATAVTAFAPRSAHNALRSAQSASPLTIARLQYDGGGDWYANPSSLPNLLAAIRERTSLDVDKV